MRKWLKKNRTAILRGYLLLIVCFIWGQSLLPQKESSAESSRVLEEVVHPVEKALTGKETITEHQVRKSAHVLEYTALGFGLMLYGADVLRRRGPVKNGKIIAGAGALFSGMFIAFLDETIQIFTGRGSMIQDVWIDTFGVAQGMAAGAVLLLIFTHCRSTKPQKKTDRDG